MAPPENRVTSAKPPTKTSPSSSAVSSFYRWFAEPENDVSSSAPGGEATNHPFE